MRKKVVLVIFISLLIILLSAGGAYFGLAKYYEDGFFYGTWINGIYCTGKSVEEVNEELLTQFEQSEIEISFEDGTMEVIALEYISYSIDYQTELERYREQQNPNLWILNFWNGKGHRADFLPTMSFDAEKLYSEVEALSVVVKAEEQKKQKVELIKTENGYELVNERFHVLDKETLKEKVEQSLKNGEYYIEVKDDCYVNMTLTQKEKEVISLWEKVQEFQNCNIRYDMGDEIIPIDASVVCDWIKLDEKGEFLFDEEGELITDEEKIKEFVEKLAEEYNTAGSDREFQATRGENVTVSGGTYGNKINTKAEIAYLTEAFAGKANELHVPEYTQEAFVRGKNDIGDTYIEVDMTEQMMYYYVDGEIYVETPVVTGNTGRRMDTPTGTCYVYNKQRNRVLRGPNYASFVNFWVPVRGNIGIHDAPWRSEYGGEIYKTNGSHGCINTPYDEMEKIYEHVEIGTPVVMFY